MTKIILTLEMLKETIIFIGKVNKVIIIIEIVRKTINSIKMLGYALSVLKKQNLSFLHKLNSITF